MIKKVCLFLFGLLYFPAVFAAVDLDEKKIESFLEIYPKYVVLAKETGVLPEKDVVDGWGAMVEEGTFSLTDANVDKEKAEQFKLQLDNLLSSQGYTAEEFSEVSAKISYIYSEITLEDAMKDLSAEEQMGMKEYTKQFSNTFEKAGITYSQNDVEFVRKNFDKLEKLFNETLAGMNV